MCVQVPVRSGVILTATLTFSKGGEAGQKEGLMSLQAIIAAALSKESSIYMRPIISW